MGDHLVAHEAAVHEQILGGASAGRGRQRDPSGESEYAGLLRHRQRMSGERIAEHRPHSRRGILSRQGPARPPIVLEREMHVRPRQCGAQERFLAMTVLGRAGAQELAPGWGVEVEISHLGRGAGRARGRRRRTDVAAGRLDLPRMAILGAFAHYAKMRHRCDACERLTAKAEARHAFQIVETLDLARRVTRDRERQILRADACAVVGDAKQPGATLGKLHRDAPRAGVETVLQQFLQGGCRALDHFARGDLADEKVRKASDGVHGDSRVAGRAAPSPVISPSGDQLLSDASTSSSIFLASPNSMRLFSL